MEMEYPKNYNNSQNEQKLEAFSDESLHEIAKEVVIKRLALIIHFWAYVFVNILLFAINYLIDYSYPWHLWVILGWGLGLTLHMFIYTLYRHGIEDLRTVAFLYHLFFWIIINGFLLAIDWVIISFPGDSSNGDIGYQKPSPWVIYTLAFWSIGLFLHLLIYIYTKPRQGEAAHESWIDRKIKKELEKHTKTN